jgi:hypothetical protein
MKALEFEFSRSELVPYGHYSDFGILDFRFQFGKPWWPAINLHPRSPPTIESVIRAFSDGLTARSIAAGPRALEALFVSR